MIEFKREYSVDSTTIFIPKHPSANSNSDQQNTTLIIESTENNTCVSFLDEAETVKCIPDDQTLIRDITDLGATVKIPIALHYEPTQEPYSLRDLTENSFLRSVSHPVLDRLIEIEMISGKEALEVLSDIKINGKTLFRSLITNSDEKRFLNIFDVLTEEFGFPKTEYLSENALINAVLNPPPDWLPMDFSESLETLALKQTSQDKTFIAVTDYVDLERDDWIRKRTGHQQLVKRLVLPSLFSRILAELRTGVRLATSHIPFVQFDGEGVVAPNTSEGLGLRMFIDSILGVATSKGASDIHFEPLPSKCRVWFRVCGERLKDHCHYTRGQHLEVARYLKPLSQLDPLITDVPNYGCVRSTIDDVTYGLRISFFPGIHGEKIVIHLMDQSEERLTLDGLGLLSEQRSKLESWIREPSGMILVAGPRGAGKTTTLYACANALLAKQSNVITFEDPVEGLLEGIMQCEAGKETGSSLAGLHNPITFQDADAIMIGQRMDRQIAVTALEMASTRLILASIQAEEASHAIVTLLTMGVDPQLLAATRIMIFAQRMVRKVCPYCVQTMSGEEVIRLMRSQGLDAKRLGELGVLIDANVEYPKPGKCSRCNQTGFSGNRPLFGFLTITEEIRHALLAGHQDIGKFHGTLQKLQGEETILNHGIKLLDPPETTWWELVSRVVGAVER